MTITVAICTFNRPDTLKKLLKDLLAQDRQPDQLVIVEDVSEQTHFSEEKLKKIFFTKKVNITYRAISARKIAQSRNMALALSTGDIVVCIDDDMRIKQKCLSQIVNTHRLFPEASAVVCRIVADSSNYWSTCSSLINNDLFFNVTSYAQPVCWTFAFVSLVRKDCQNLLFNPSLATGEDIDFTSTMTERGLTLLFTGKIAVKHTFTRSFSDFVVTYARYAKDYRRLYRLHPTLLTSIKNYFPHFLFQWLALPFFLILQPTFLAIKTVVRIQVSWRFFWGFAIKEYVTMAVIYKELFVSLQTRFWQSVHATV